MPWSPRLVAAACALVVAGCGPDPAPTKSKQAGSSGEVLDEVLAACTAFAQRLCESAGPCCEQSAPFVQDDCVSSFVEDVCTPSAQLVAAGKATYDASAEDACLAAHDRAHQTCVADWEETVAIRRDIWASCNVVSGNVIEGHSCETDAMCAPSSVSDSTSACAEHVCQTIAILGDGAECPFPNGDVSTCDVGLYCTAVDQGTVGTCEPATPEGADCEPEFLNVECGLGSYCDLTEGVCKKATNYGGPSCTQDTECVSFVCDRAAQQCRPALSTAASLCGGS